MVKSICEISAFSEMEQEYPSRFLQLSTTINPGCWV